MALAAAEVNLSVRCVRRVIAGWFREVQCSRSVLFQLLQSQRSAAVQIFPAVPERRKGPGK